MSAPTDGAAPLELEMVRAALAAAPTDGERERLWGSGPCRQCGEDADACQCPATPRAAEEEQAPDILPERCPRCSGPKDWLRTGFCIGCGWSPEKERPPAAPEQAPAGEWRCDYRKPGCVNDGVTVDGVWRCRNHLSAPIVPPATVQEGAERERHSPGGSLFGDGTRNWPHGDYMGTCCICGERFCGPKRAPRCYPCHHDEPAIATTERTAPAAREVAATRALIAGAERLIAFWDGILCEIDRRLVTTPQHPCAAAHPSAFADGRAHGLAIVDGNDDPFTCPACRRSLAVNGECYHCNPIRVMAAAALNGGTADA